MSQSFKQIVHEIAGLEKDPLVYDFSRAGKHGKFYERKSRGAYDSSNDDSNITFEDGIFIQFEKGTFLEAE